MPILAFGGDNVGSPPAPGGGPAGFRATIKYEGRVEDPEYAKESTMEGSRSIK